MVILSANAIEYTDARKLLSNQKWSEALPLLKKLNEEDPDSVIVAQDLAQVLLRLNRREEALELLKRHHLSKQADIAAKAFLSKDSFRFYQQGLDWLSKKSYSQACERFEKALEKDQAHYEILLRLGQCEILDSNADLALKALDSFERIHGKTTESTVWRARALALRGKFEEALVLFAMNASTRISEPTLELNTLWWAEALLAAGQKNQAATLLENDAKRFSSHFQTTLLSLKLRASAAESPNQFLALESDLDDFDRALTRRISEKKKRNGDTVFDLFDGDELRRGATEVRTQIKPQLPQSAKPTSA